MAEQKLITYRDLILSLVPRWLHKGGTSMGTAGKLLYSIGIQLDSLSDALVAGVKRRFPGLNAVGYDALPLHGKERRIARGPFETDAGYAARLLPWLDGHRIRGNPYAMLQQLYGFWLGAFPMAIVNRDGRRYTLATDGTITRDYIAGWVDTSDDGAFPTTHPLIHWKLFFYWTPTIGNDGLWGSLGSSGDMHWGDGGLWGTDLTPQQVQNIMLVPTEWNAAHTNGFVTLLPPAIWADTSMWQAPGLVSIAIY